MGGLAYIEIFSVGFVPRGNHLHPDFTVRDSVDGSLAIFMGFQLKALILLFTILRDRMENDLSIAHRLSIVIFEHYKLERRRLVLRHAQQCRQQDESNKFFKVSHKPYCTKGKRLRIGAPHARTLSNYRVGQVR